jgi:hypothetical protein
MRLLSFKPNGDLTYTEFAPASIPPYAILSHTWGAEEVTFDDLLSDSAKRKAGYEKIIFCGTQAVRDDLEYFWCDTCCIDKRNSSELSKAINSMFRWYRNAAMCYVYMADVHTPRRVDSSVQGGRIILLGDGLEISTDAPDESYRDEWEADFRKSRWFTRGWTLQELLAPAHVEFYSAELQLLGDKESLCDLISEITNIPATALRGRSLDNFSVSTRMDWATERHTTEEEDGAYCLMGLFSIFMPLIYGEGKDSALRRLRKEIEGLPQQGKT